MKSARVPLQARPESFSSFPSRPSARGSGPGLGLPSVPSSAKHSLRCICRRHLHVTPDKQESRARRLVDQKTGFHRLLTNKGLIFAYGILAQFAVLIPPARPHPHLDNVHRVYLWRAHLPQGSGRLQRARLPVLQLRQLLGVSRQVEPLVYLLLYCKSLSSDGSPIPHSVPGRRPRGPASLAAAALTPTVSHRSP